VLGRLFLSLLIALVALTFVQRTMRRVRRRRDALLARVGVRR